MPEPFPWKSAPEPERYVTVDLAILDAIRKLAELQQAAHLVLRVARVDRVSGRIVFSARLVRDLNDKQ